MFYTKMNKSARTDYLAYCLQSRRVGYSLTLKPLTENDILKIPSTFRINLQSASTIIIQKPSNNIKRLLHKYINSMKQVRHKIPWLRNKKA